MDNNKNDDLLKVENYEQNEYVVASSIVEPPVEKAAKAEKKVTLFNVLVSAVSLNKKKDDATYTALRPIKTLKFVIVIAVITLLLFLMSKFADAKLFIPALVFEYTLPKISVLIIEPLSSPAFPLTPFSLLVDCYGQRCVFNRDVR